MAANPLIPQGVLNRLITSMVVVNFPELNVVASYLGKGSIELDFTGNVTTEIPTLTGAVMSPEPYQVVGITLNLLKTQNLANLWKGQYETNTLLGPINVFTDASQFPKFGFFNCAIQGLRGMNLGGTDAGYNLNLVGYYLTNQNLWP